MEHPLLKIFRNLEGEWVLTRKINDAVNNNTDYAEGIALFRPLTGTPMDGEILDYEENGVLTLTAAKKQLNFKRNYLYKFQDNEIEIYLNDGVTKGKLFQKLLQSSDGDQCAFTGTEHSCRSDKHNGSYYFRSNDAFETSFSIEGDNKRVIIETAYRKVEKK